MTLTDSLSTDEGHILRKYCYGIKTWVIMCMKLSMSNQNIEVLCDYVALSREKAVRVE